MTATPPSMAFQPRQTSDFEGKRPWFSHIEPWLESEREQIGLWAPVALGTGILAWFGLPDARAWLGWCCAGLALATGSTLLPAGARLRHIVAAAGLLACVGCLIVWAKAAMLGQPPLARPAFVDIAAVVRSIEPRPARGDTRVTVRPLDRTDLPPRIRVNIRDSDLPAGMKIGATIRFRARLMPPAPPAVPGAYDFAQRAYFQGIGATGRALAPIRVVRPGEGGGPSLRQRLSAHVRSRMATSEGSIAAALATGDLGAISDADAEAMRRSGLAHLLSISGLHVTALIGAVIFLLFRLLALSPRLALHWPLMLIAAGGGALAGIGYTLLTGAEVPTVRSAVAALLVLGGLALGREAITLRLVAAGALFVLLLWPESLLGPSFQMSFAAVTAIVALAEMRWFRAVTSARDEGWGRKAARTLLGLFLTGLAVEIVLAPIALYHFHQAGMLGSAANLVAIPLTTFVIMPFEALALFLDIAGIGAPAWWVVEQALHLLLLLAHAVASSPAAVAAMPSFSAAPLILIAAGGVWSLLWRSRQRWWGIVPAAVGSVMVLATPAPDVLVTGDGRHVAIRTQTGAMAVLRDRAGDYVRDTLSESAGYEGELGALAQLPEARCSPDLCALAMDRAGRRWRLLATRSFNLVDARQLAADCEDADIVVSDRRLPRNCRPRWLKLDKAALRQTGGLAIYLNDGTVRTVRKAGDAHPWVIR